MTRIGARGTHRGSARWLVLLGLALAPVAARGSDALVRYDQHRVLRFVPADEDQLRHLLAAAEDVWTERPGVGMPVDVRVTAATAARLQADGLVAALRIADVQRAVDAERARLRASAGSAGAPSSWFDEFRDWEAIESELDALAQRQPSSVRLESVGTSLRGRPIRALRIGGSAGGPGLLVTGTLHAREWLSPMAVMCIAEAMVTGYGADPDTTALLDELELLLVPVVNPDGYVYSWTTDRYWRKNRRDDHGVDLNRNWDVAWGGVGSSADPEAGNHHGAAPRSEPEAAALAAFIEANPHLVAHVDLHAYGPQVLYPWGYQEQPAPDDELLWTLAERMSAAIEATHDRPYPALQGAELYPASGAVDDWSYGALGMMAFTIELRGDDFVVPPSQIVPACEEASAAVWTLAQWAIDRQVPPPPPTATDDGVASASASDGSLPGGTAAGEGASADGPEVTSTGAPRAGDGPAGCACASARSPGRSGSGWWSWLGGLLWVVSRRRRLTSSPAPGRAPATAGGGAHLRSPR